MKQQGTCRLFDYFVFIKKISRLWLFVDSFCQWEIVFLLQFYSKQYDSHNNGLGKLSKEWHYFSIHNGRSSTK